MSDDNRYLPSDFFLQLCSKGDLPIGSEGIPLRNLECLIELVADPNPVNRDWATFLLSQSDIDTPEVRSALLRAANDVSRDVRVEALVGLSIRSKELALPLIQEELKSGWMSIPIFEAASYIGDPKLCKAIEFSLEGEDRSEPDDVVSAGLSALQACQDSAPAEPPVEFVKGSSKDE